MLLFGIFPDGRHHDLDDIGLPARACRNPDLLWQLDLKLRQQPRGFVFIGLSGGRVAQRQAEDFHRPYALVLGGSHHCGDTAAWPRHRRWHDAG